jgi:hypothetical protein
MNILSEVPASLVLNTVQHEQAATLVKQSLVYCGHLDVSAFINDNRFMQFLLIVPR